MNGYAFIHLIKSNQPFSDVGTVFVFKTRKEAVQAAIKYAKSMGSHFNNFDELDLGLPLIDELEDNCIFVKKVFAS